MGTVVLSCGCAVGRSMVGERELLHVSPCLKHAIQPEIQRLMGELAELLLKGAA